MIGLVGYHIYDFATHMANVHGARWTVSADDYRVAADLVEERRRFPASTLHADEMRSHSVIMVSAESLQGFILGLEIDGHAITPNLDLFATESLHFTRFHDQTHSSTTADAEFLALQSLYPLPHGAVATRYPMNDFHALPAILAEHGYTTISACAESPAFWNMRQMHPQLGFQQSWFRDAYPDGETIGLGLADEPFLVETAARLAGLDQPFLAYLITSTTHHPYVMPLAHRTVDVGRLEGTTLGNYIHAIHYLDRAFGLFIGVLRDRGLLDRSLVVVFGDHEGYLSEEPGLVELLVSNDRLAPGTQELAPLDRWRLSRDVPLLIRHPGDGYIGNRSTAGGQLDIAPTVLSMLGLPDDLGGVMLGRDLLVGGSNPVLFRDGSVATDSAIFVRGLDTTFDVATGRSAAGNRSQYAAMAARDFQASDAIIRGNLVPRLLTHGVRPSHPPLPARTLAIAHRGDSARAPENTALAIDLAFQTGVDVVEVDVRLSRDGVPVIVHEDTLEQTTNGSGPAAALTLAELKRLDAGSWMHPRFTGERIQTLEEALAIARGRGRLLLDIKADGMAPLVAEIYRRVGMPASEAIIGAWTQEEVEDYVRCMPGALILRSHGTISPWDVEYFEWLKASGVRGIELGEYWSPALVDAARSVGLMVICYTVNDEGTMRRLIRMGVDGIESDDASLAVRVCRERRE